MNTNTAELLQQMIDIKKDIRSSINRKGVVVVGGMVTYPDAINRIPNITGIDSDIDYTQIGWSNTDSERQNSIDAERITSNLEYSKTYLDRCDASQWTEKNEYSYSPFEQDKKLVYVPYIYNLSGDDCYHMFDGCNFITAVPQLDTSNVWDMGYMFCGCSSLTAIPQLDTSNVSDMTGMFDECSSLTTIPQLDTSNVSYMTYMFDGCSSLTAIPQLNTSNVTDMVYMFYECSSLTTIPQLDTSNVKFMSNMFQYCSSLTSIPQLDTSNAVYMSGMFWGCSNLTTIPQLDTSNVTSMSDMFIGCSELTNLGGFRGLKTELNLSECPKLTHESLMNVLNNLETVSDVNLILGETNLAKLTDEEKSIATNKGWTLS